MTQEEFKALGTGHHVRIRAEWNGRKWRLSTTIQSTETVILQPIGTRSKYPVATGYRYVTIIEDKRKPKQKDNEKD